MRVALVYDWLTVYAGGERVLEQLIQLYPQADIFTLVDFLPAEQRAFLANRPVRTSFIQKLPFARKHFRKYFPFFPLAIQSFDFAGYDLVISASFSVAKGVITGPEQLHIGVSCSPMRYAWDMQEHYLREHGYVGGLKTFFVRLALHRMRIWDAAMAHLVDEYVATSLFVRERIRKFYGRSSFLIYPPVAVEEFEMRSEKEDFYLAVSRQVPYKRLDLIVEAFRRMPNRNLVVIGTGSEHERLKMMAKDSPNIRILGHQPFPVVKAHMQRARAFVFAPKEDFGIVVLEAQACGTPVIAFGQGGARETLRVGGSNPTGVFFSEQTPESLCDAVERFEEMTFAAGDCRANAMRFSAEIFRREFANFADQAIARSAERLP